MQSLRWENTVARKCTFVESVRLDDAFALMRVETKSLREFSVVAGLLPVIKNFTKLLETTPVHTIDSHQFMVIHLPNIHTALRTYFCLCFVLVDDGDYTGQFPGVLDSRQRFSQREAGPSSLSQSHPLFDPHSAGPLQTAPRIPEHFWFQPEWY